MDNSILYGLRNPAMTDDIGMSMIERQYPTTIDNMSYGFADGTAPKINNGQPSKDTYQTKREKEYSAIKKILIGLGVVALGALGLKFGYKYIKKGYENIAPQVKDIFSKVKKNFTDLFNKKVSP